MCLESCDTLRFACLTDSIHGVADSHLSLDGLQLLVKCDKHTWVE